MAMTDAIFSAGGPAPSDGWAWWQARRAGYNVGLAIAGIAAYLLAVALSALGATPMWLDWQDAVSTTIALGTVYLVVMGAANVCFLLGPLAEALIRPADPAGFRRSAFAMGFWGSFALPFVVPAITLAAVIGAA